MSNKDIEKFEEILATNNITIPTLYFDYLTSNYFDNRLSIFEDEDDFTLYNIEELCETTNIDGQKFLRIQELKGYIKTILEVNEDYFDEKSKKKYEEISNCLAIGYRNTEVLFIDKKDNNTLYIFHPDGGDFEKVKRVTLKDIVEEKKKAN